MDLTQLRMFCLVAESNSVARAAEQLHRVSSNVTTRIKQLEEEVGAPLFIRERQRLRLSPLGHHFLDYAQKILALSDEALSLAKNNRPNGSLTLGSMDSIAATRLPSLLAAYHQRYPEVTLSLETGTSGEILAGVLAGRIDAALTDTPAPQANIRSVVAFSDRLILITHQDHPTVKAPSDLQQETFFAFRPSCSYRQMLENWFYQAGLTPHHIMEIQSYHAMIACVAGGAGAAVMPESLLSQMTDRGRVKVHALPDPFSQLTSSLIWRADNPSVNITVLSALLPEIYPVP